MAYSLTIGLALGSSQTGLTLRANLKDTAGVAVGGTVTTGFVELGAGNYSWTGTIPSAFQGSVVFADNGTAAVLAVAPINPSDDPLTPVSSVTGDVGGDLLGDVSGSVGDVRGIVGGGVVGTVGGVATPVTLAANQDVRNVTGTVSDKAGYKLAADGLDTISAAEPPAKPTTFRGWVMWLVQRFRRAELTATGLTVKTEAGAVVTTQVLGDDGVTQTVGPPV